MEHIPPFSLLWVLLLGLRTHAPMCFPLSRPTGHVLSSRLCRLDAHLENLMTRTRSPRQIHPQFSRDPTYRNIPSLPPSLLRPGLGLSTHDERSDVHRQRSVSIAPMFKASEFYRGPLRPIAHSMPQRTFAMYPPSYLTLK
ncbi:hypothetical protein JAAARDRAFT_429480 [Jaapia argillacea MUCL 33604]|uniref:Uncharacterized protein n=1 Tax=Jaapia argillacea MUCL 33604 TaxID=933084 RepID=A0A067PF98_9AGAM|nr:hypothetical protein JAAARDRAFT_429480 [Jaapia argillacea MUCL 33604]